MTIKHRFEFPVLPPPINACRMAMTFKGRARIIDTPEYRSWKPGSKMYIESTRLRLPETTYWRALILVPGASKADADAYNKQVIDCLVSAKAVPDDRYLCDCRFKWHDGENLVVIVRTEQIEPWATIRRAGKTIRKHLQPRLL